MNTGPAVDEHLGARTQSVDVRSLAQDGVMRTATFALGIALLTCCNCTKPSPPPLGSRDPQPSASVPAPSVTPASAPAPIVAATGDASAGCEPTKPKEGRSAAPVPDRPKPKKGAFHSEPSFNTCFVRATDHAKDGVDTFSRNDYSRRQPFNADSTLFITSANDGSWHLYDAKTLRHVGSLPQLQGDAEPQWHPTDPNVLYYGERNGGMTVRSLDVKTRMTRVAFSLKGKLPWPNAARAWTKAEGSPSRDGRYWALQVETEKFDILGFAVFDLVEDKVVGTMPMTSRPDHVSMSPSGRWFVSSGDDTIAWSRDFKEQRKLRKGGEHSDLAIGKNGHDYYVSIDYQKDGDLFMLDIDTGERTDLFRTYLEHTATAVHFSGKAFDKPGWVLVSTYDGYGGPTQWFWDKVFAGELAPNPRVYQLAAHHSAVAGQYFAEPHASANRDFTRVIFNSNWGTKASTDVDAYMILLPPDALP